MIQAYRPQLNFLPGGESVRPPPDLVRVITRANRFQISQKFDLLTNTYLGSTFCKCLPFKDTLSHCHR